jgi:hypothetical protein
MFTYSLQPSFVEREHSATDAIGDNTIEEGLEVGVLRSMQHAMSDYFNGRSILVMATVDLTNDNFPTFSGGEMEGLYSGCGIFRVKNASTMKTLFDKLNEAGKTDAIVTIWEYPSTLITLEGSASEAIVLVTKSSNAEGNRFVMNRPFTIDNYTPRNNKLFTYPYCYMYAYNHQGTSAIYRYEHFEKGTTNFEYHIEGSIFPDGGVRVTPKNYKGAGFNYDEAITVTNFPTCPWVSDTYKIWLAQNQSQQAMQYAVGGASIVGGIASMFTGNILAGAGLAFGGVTAITSALAQVQDMEKQPPQSHGAHSATLNACTGTMGIHFMQKTITAERARIIDDYFTMFGYKTLRVKVPNRNVRQSFTYTKTNGCLITGSMPQEDARKIQSIYDNGVTFWQKDVAIGNYSASNAVK